MAQSHYTTLPVLTGQEVTYLLHFSEPLGNKATHQAQHYAGKTNDLERRLAEHRQGTGAAITRACKKRNIGVSLARVYHGYQWERKLKRSKNLKFYCPICIQEKLARLLVPTPLIWIEYSRQAKQLCLPKNEVRA